MVANNNDCKVSKNKHTTDEDNNKQMHSQINIHSKKINKIEKYKKLNMTEHKTDMNVSEKLNSTSMMQYKKMNITEKLSSTFTTKHKTEYNYTLVEQHFYDVIQNRIQLHFGEPKKGVTNLKTQDQKG